MTCSFCDEWEDRFGEAEKSDGSRFTKEDRIKMSRKMIRDAVIRANRT